MGYVLGIDTSNYKTSIAVIDHKKHIICDLRRFLTVKQGERGLRQSDALFQHIQNLPELMEEMRRMFDGRIDAVACSFRPRPEAGSYMPVFLAGSGFAKAAAAAMNVPVVGFSHQEGHMEAIRAYSPFQTEDRFLACHFPEERVRYSTYPRRICGKTECRSSILKEVRERTITALLQRNRERTITALLQRNREQTITALLQKKRKSRIRQIPLSGAPTPCTSPEARRIFLLDKSWIAPE